MKLFLFLCIFVACFTLVKCVTLKNVDFEGLVKYQQGNKIYLKKGTFSVSKPLIFPNGVSIIGNETTLVVDDNHPYPIVKIEHASDIKVSGISIECKPLKYTNDKNYLQKVNYYYGVSILGSKSIQIENCHFRNLEGTGIKVLDSENISITKCSFKDMGYASFDDVGYSCDGIYLGGYKYIKDVKIDLCSFENIGMSFPRGKKNWPNDGDGIQILTEGIAEQITITNCYFDRCSSRGIKIQNGDGVTVKNSIFKNGHSAVLMPMHKGLKNINILNNKIYNTQIIFGTDKPGASIDAINLVIEDNTVDSCVYFFRTSGTSNVRNCTIKGNKIDKVSQFVISGRFFDSNIIDNNVGLFASEKNPNWNMAILMSPESENVTIENNTFRKTTNKDVLIDNRSKNKITLKNNTLSAQ